MTWLDYILPRKKYWFPLLAGLALLLVLNVAIPIPLLGTIAGALLADYVASRKVTLRGFFGLAFLLVGVQGVVLSILLLFGVGLIEAFSVAGTMLAGAFTVALGFLLGVVAAVLGIVFLVIGNLILER
jgi:hypothetical protein